MFLCCQTWKINPAKLTGQFHMRNEILLPLICEDKRPNVKRRKWNVGQISNQNKGDIMMKIEMKHHPRSYCVVEFRGTIPNWSAWLEFSSILWYFRYRLTYSPLVSKQERTLTDFVFQVTAWVPLHLIKVFKLTKIIGVEHKVIK